MIKVHQLKCWPAYFDPIVKGLKTYDLRKNDRDFKVGDEVQLEEWRPGTKQYTGRLIRMRIVALLTKFEGLEEGYAILGLSPVDGEPPHGQSDEPARA